MRILLSNDDGYQAPGIVHLEQALSEMAEVVVFAPDRNRSGASNSLTLDRPLTVRQYKDNGFYVNGTPTDCVHLALNYFLKEVHVDMVVSGINHGSNLGDDVLYSGTVAAAMQGRFLGRPSVAFSLQEPAKDFFSAAQVAKKIVARLASHHLPASTILNVNIPHVPFAEIKGYEVTRLGTRHSSDSVLRQIDPRGNEVYWIGTPGPEQDSGSGTDFFALKSSKVSVTPLNLDWTNYVFFESLSAWIAHL